MIGKGSLKRVCFSLCTQVPIYQYVSGTSRCFISSKGHGEDFSLSGRCPFKTLGISQSSSIEAVKTAYRAKCRTEHPDVGGTDEGFRKIAWAYEECTRRVHERYRKNDGENTSESVNMEDKQWRDENHKQESSTWYESRTELHRRQRQMFYAAFSHSRSIEEMEELLLSSLRSHCFDIIDVSEPLALLLRRLHLITGYGETHLQACFAAMDNWEQYTERRAGAGLYHILLQLYTDFPKPGLTETIITESVETLLERMHTKGLEYDDWTLTLAHKAYRASPWPT
ncbi:chaperone DnaJ protein [Trypanosoma theileri]|uniref:Chaperone DnaJ protein n=1 Tax=Trypanosoma theileri TaxID=67003 RepID=A0A1X0P1P0_9TRYP|nr:chaperone DnaJ protein [Trypanosoma theileri]XP_028884884.1 chaperone DnaJ protein [Trypanosoma theileri]ORC90815.1 chaperone DnaJ protein [Trypanosoma theileri]ORC90818.1 chaperone DnaJ protein [Trypanosoma theileri]